jgi:hypothetical protein
LIFRSLPTYKGVGGWLDESASAGGVRCNTQIMGRAASGVQGFSSWLNCLASPVIRRLEQKVNDV